MSLEVLQADLLENANTFKSLRDSVNVQNLWAHIHNTLYPFLKNMVDELESQDDAIIELAEQTGDMLQPESAGIFSAIIIGARKLAAKLDPSNLNPEIVAFLSMCDEGEALLADITIDTDDDEEEEDASEAVNPNPPG